MDARKECSKPFLNSIACNKAIDDLIAVSEHIRAEMDGIKMNGYVDKLAANNIHNTAMEIKLNIQYVDMRFRPSLLNLYNAGRGDAFHQELRRLQQQQYELNGIMKSSFWQYDDWAKLAAFGKKDNVWTRADFIK